jgi:hypothetical protein
MPATKYAGSPMGSGNPPGEHSEEYLSPPGSGTGHFVASSTYRADTGRAESEKVVGNQPAEKKEDKVEKFSNQPSI